MLGDGVDEFRESGVGEREEEGGVGDERIFEGFEAGDFEEEEVEDIVWEVCKLACPGVDGGRRFGGKGMGFLWRLVRVHIL